MRDIWYSDNRDLAKWGFLMYLARESALRSVIQIPYWRPELDRPSITFQDSIFQVPEKVWQFFRDIRHIEQLGDAFSIPVSVLTEPFDPRDRKGYARLVSEQITKGPRPVLVFLDPDTGLEPKHLSDTHVTRTEVGEAWSELLDGDWLVLYQHARRTTNWIEEVSAELSRICSGLPIRVARSEKVGKDVAFLCARKGAG